MLAIKGGSAGSLPPFSYQQFPQPQPPPEQRLNPDYSGSQLEGYCPGKSTEVHIQMADSSDFAFQIWTKKHLHPEVECNKVRFQACTTNHYWGVVRDFGLCFYRVFLVWDDLLFFIFLFFNPHLRTFIDFRERGRDTEIETLVWERNINKLPPICIPLGDGTQNPGMCPD